MQAVYFISDAHIGSRNLQNEIIKEQYLIDFFNYLESQNNVSLYIVGDLFDFWFEYHWVIPNYYQRILSKMLILREKGIPITFVTGNHDFWMREFFPTQMGIKVYHGIHTTQLGGKQFFIFHGDGIIKRDIGYRLMKRFLQHPFIIKIYQFLHPDIGIPIARYASHLSRNHYQQDIKKQHEEDQEYLNFAVEQFNKGYDFVIMGHSHRPMKVAVNSRIYVNLGDWLSHFTYALFDGSQLTLKKWELKSGSKERKLLG